MEQYAFTITFINGEKKEFRYNNFVAALHKQGDFVKKGYEQEHKGHPIYQQVTGVYVVEK